MAREEGRRAFGRENSSSAAAGEGWFKVLKTVLIGGYPGVLRSVESIENGGWTGTSSWRALLGRGKEFGFPLCSDMEPQTRLFSREQHS